MTVTRGRKRTGLAALIVAVTMMAVGCSRGPDATALRTEVQGKLDQRFKPGLFQLAGFRRQGSAPLPGSETGASRTWRRWPPRARGPSPREGPSRRSAPSAVCSRSPCTSSSRPPRRSGRSRTSAANGWRSARRIPAPGPTPSPCSPPTGSRSRIFDSVFQWAILGASYPGPALVVGPVLIATPYALARALSNRVARAGGLPR